MRTCMQQHDSEWLRVVEDHVRGAQAPRSDAGAVTGPRATAAAAAATEHEAWLREKVSYLHHTFGLTKMNKQINPPRHTATHRDAPRLTARHTATNRGSPRRSPLTAAHRDTRQAHTAHAPRATHRGSPQRIAAHRDIAPRHTAAHRPSPQRISRREPREPRHMISGSRASAGGRAAIDRSMRASERKDERTCTREHP